MSSKFSAAIDILRYWIRPAFSGGRRQAYLEEAWDGMRMLVWR